MVNSTCADQTQSNNGRVKSKYWGRTHNFELKIPIYVAEAKSFYEYNVNTLGWDSICKEMKNFRPEFKIWEGYTSELPHEYQKTCHIIFYVNMGEHFRRKY